MQEAKKKAANVTKVKFKTKERTFTAKEMLASVAKDPDRAANVVKGGLTVQAESQVLDWAHNTPLGQYVEDDGEVTTSGLTGFEEALIFIAVVGFFGGLAVGYLKGYEDGLEDGQATVDSPDDSDGGGDSGDDSGGDDSGGDSGGDTGGDTGGGEDGH